MQDCSRRSLHQLLPILFVLWGCGAAEEVAPEQAEMVGGIPRAAFHRPASQTTGVGGVPVYHKEVLSAVFTVNEVWHSMQGPVSNIQVRFEDAGKPELIWVIGYDALMVTADGKTDMSQEFMCHSNLIIDPDEYHERFDSRIRTQGGRLFTLAQGQLSLQLPDGFGMPWMSDQPFIINNQVLNHNIVDRTLEVRSKITVNYIRDADLPKPLKPLIQRGVFGLKLLEGTDGHFGLMPEQASGEEVGPGCSLGEDAGSEELITDSTGKRFTGFWVVPPGREVNRTRVTSMFALPYDTTIHYVAVHLHPFAEYLELRDLTTGESVYRANASQVDERLGLASVEHYSSGSGIPVYKDHEYELVSVYNNTTGVEQDAMASMFIYLRAQDLYEMDFRPVAANP